LLSRGEGSSGGDDGGEDGRFHFEIFICFIYFIMKIKGIVSRLYSYL